MRRLAPMDYAALGGALALSAGAAFAVQSTDIAHDGASVTGIPWPVLYLVELALLAGSSR